MNESVEEAIIHFKKKFEKLYEWISNNRLFINWSKTKFMIISKQEKPPTIKLLGFEVEVVSEFRLLGIIIDDKLTFHSQVEALQKTVNKKVFALKRIFYLSSRVKLHFFKTFILPHFDYCASLFIYLTKTLLDKVARLYNSCIFNLLRIDLSEKTEVEQLQLLTPFNLFPFLDRFFFRFSLFSFKILTGQILPEQKESLSENHISYNLRKKADTYLVDLCTTLKCSRRLSIFFPKFCNKIINDKCNKIVNHELKLCEFKNYLLNNLLFLGTEFRKYFYEKHFT
jgi:hypothetical protein